MRRWAVMAILVLAGCGPVVQPIASASPVTATPTPAVPSSLPSLIPLGPPLPAGRPLSKGPVLNYQDAVVAAGAAILRTADGAAHCTCVSPDGPKDRSLP